MDTIVSALRFFLIQTLDKPNMAHMLVYTRYERKLPVMLLQDEMAKLLAATRPEVSIGKVGPGSGSVSRCLLLSR